MGCALYLGVHYTQVNMVYVHITYKNTVFQHSLEKRELCWNCLLLFSIILKVFLLLDFIKCTTSRREKTPSFFDDSNENSRIIPSHLSCNISAKDCLVCLKKIKMICDRNFKKQIFTACILEFVFFDCLLQETIIDNCNKLCSVESILETLCGVVTMQWRFLPFWRGCLKI